MPIFFMSVLPGGSGDIGSGDTPLLIRFLETPASTPTATLPEGSEDLGSGDTPLLIRFLGTPASTTLPEDLGSGGTPLLIPFPQAPAVLSTPAATPISSLSSGPLLIPFPEAPVVLSTPAATPISSLSSGPLLIPFPEAPVVLSTPAATPISSLSPEPTTSSTPGVTINPDVTFANLGGVIPSDTLNTTAVSTVLGVICTILTMILIIIVIAYAIKKYHKRMGHYRPHLPRRPIGLLDEERLVCNYYVCHLNFNFNANCTLILCSFLFLFPQEFVGNHMYDLPKYIVKPPPLPPRKVFPLVNKSTLESSTEDISITAAESTFILNNDYGQGHTPGERYCKNENCEIQPDLSRHIYHNTMAGMSGQKNETNRPVLTNTQICSSITERVSEPTTSQTAILSDPQTNRSTSSKDIKQLSTYEGPQLHTAECSHFDSTAENTCDHESYAEHQSYEQACTYKKVQLCDVEHSLLPLHKEATSQDPSVLIEASNNESNEDSGITEFTDLCTTIENTRDHESDSEQQSYEKVCSYENVQPCDVEHILLHLSKEAQSQDPSLHSKASKNESSGDNIMKFTAAKHTDSCTTVQSCESDSEHQSYEQVYSYEKVQPCDVEHVLLHINKEEQHQDPSVLSKASNNESNNDSGFTDICTAIENTHDHESDSEYQSYEKVYPNEKVQLCDVEHSLLPLNEEVRSQDPSVLGNASKNESTEDSGITEFTDLCTTIENARDSESDSEHQSYEQVYSYEKVQPCDVENLIPHLNEEAQHRDPSVLGNASENESHGFTDFCAIVENTCDSELDSEHQSYEQVYSYEKVNHCDLLLEEFMVQKDNQGHVC